MSALWQSWLHGDLPWLVLTLGAYLLAVWLYKRSNFYPLLVPVFTAVALVVAVLERFLDLATPAQTRMRHLPVDNFLAGLHLPHYPD